MGWSSPVYFPIVHLARQVFSVHPMTKTEPSDISMTLGNDLYNDLYNLNLYEKKKKKKKNLSW